MKHRRSLVHTHRVCRQDHRGGASPEKVTHSCSVTLVHVGTVYMCTTQCTSTSTKEISQNTNSWGHLNYFIQHGNECIRSVCNPTDNTNFLLNVHQIALVFLTDAFFPVGLGFVCFGFFLRKADFI